MQYLIYPPLGPPNLHHLIRSRQIELILITASLASCNHNFSPARNRDYDWVYETNYPYQTFINDSTNYCGPVVPWEYYNYWYYAGNPGRINSIKFSLKGSVTRKSNFTFRGGWGSHGFASS